MMYTWKAYATPELQQSKKMPTFASTLGDFGFDEKKTNTVIMIGYWSESIEH
jgi:hypothetical protein